MKALLLLGLVLGASGWGATAPTQPVPYARLDPCLERFEQTLGELADSAAPEAFASGNNGSAVVGETTEGRGGFEHNALGGPSQSAQRRAVGGGLSGTVASGDYEVTADLVIHEGTTLVLEPGVRLFFPAGRRLDVHGSLVADAQGGPRIIFTSAREAPEAGDWAGIALTLSSGASNSIRGVEIAYAQTGVTLTGHAGGVAKIEGCDLHDHQESGIEVSALPDGHIGSDIGTSKAAVRLLDNRIHGNRIGVLLTASADGCRPSSNSALVSGNEIFGNREQGLLASARWSNGCIPRRYSTVDSHITRNRFHHNAIGIQLTGRPAVSGGHNEGQVRTRIANNLVISNSQSGLDLQGVFGGVLANNSILNNGGAGVTSDLKNNAAPTLHNNLIVGNAVGVHAVQPLDSQLSGVTHNNLFANGVAWANYPAEFGELTGVNPKGTPADPYMNLSVEPAFATLPDYRLAPRSPLIDAGTVIEAPQEDFEGDRRLNVPDIGWDETPSTFTGVITTLLDEADGFLGWGTGDSLREVIVAANFLPGEQRIEFDTALSGGVIVLAGRELPALTDDLTILGPGAEALVIDANQKSRVFSIAPGVEVLVAGLTLRGGLSPPAQDGGVVLTAGRLTLDHCLLSSSRANYTGSRGGAVANLTTGQLTMESCVLSSNESSLLGGALLNHGVAVVRSSRFEGNVASYGGGAIANWGMLRIEGGSFLSNRAFSDKGGAVANRGGLTVLDSVFSENVGPEGGGLANLETGAAELHDCEIRSCGSVRGGGGGGGVFNAPEASLKLHRCVLRENSALGNGGGILNYGTLVIHDGLLAANVGGDGDGGALASLGGSVVIERSTFTRNVSTGRWSGQGGAARSQGRFTARDSLFADNRARSGGALAITLDTALANCTFSANEATGAPGGGGALWIEGATATLVNCTITSNRVSGRWYGGGGGLHVTGESARVTLANTILASNATVLSGGDPDLLILSGAVEHQGRFNFIGGDPRLGPLADNGGPTWTHLPLRDSPLTDAGANELALDFAGHPLETDQRGFARVQHGRVDIGAVESLPPDMDGDSMPNEWEAAHGLDPEDPADALQDWDGDGSTNLEEYLADTHPRDAGSNLRLLTIERIPGTIRLSIRETSVKRVYTLEHRASLAEGAWEPASSADALAGNGARMDWPAPAGQAPGFYRVRVEMMDSAN